MKKSYTNPTQSKLYALNPPDEFSTLAFRLWYQTQLFKYSKEYNKANKLFRTILSSILDNPESIKHDIFWEMGNYYDEDMDNEEIQFLKDWLIQQIEEEIQDFGEDSIISFKLYDGNSKELYFCIPISLLDPDLAIKALNKATPIQPIIHSRDYNKVNNLKFVH